MDVRAFASLQTRTHSVSFQTMYLLDSYSAVLQDGQLTMDDRMSEWLRWRQSGCFGELNLPHRANTKRSRVAESIFTPIAPTQLSQPFVAAAHLSVPAVEFVVLPPPPAADMGKPTQTSRPFHSTPEYVRGVHGPDDPSAAVMVSLHP